MAVWLRRVISFWIDLHLHLHLHLHLLNPAELYVAWTHTKIIKEQLYAPQTKILDGRRIGRTNVWERIFEVLFKGVSTRFGLRSFESSSKMRSQMFIRTSKIFVWGA